MSKADEIQQAINRASLTMNVGEDVAKACKAAEVHPLLATVLMRIHTAQVELDKEVRDLRTSMLKLAQTVAMGADVTAATQFAISQLGARVGVELQSLFTPDDGEQDDPNVS